MGQVIADNIWTDILPCSSNEIDSLFQVKIWFRASIHHLHDVLQLVLQLVIMWLKAFDNPKSRIWRWLVVFGGRKLNVTLHSSTSAGWLDALSNSRSILRSWRRMSALSLETKSTKRGIHSSFSWVDVVDVQLHIEILETSWLRSFTNHQHCQLLSHCSRTWVLLCLYSIWCHAPVLLITFFQVVFERTGRFCSNYKCRSDCTR